MIMGKQKWNLHQIILLSKELIWRKSLSRTSKSLKYLEKRFFFLFFMYLLLKSNLYLIYFSIN